MHVIVDYNYSPPILIFICVKFIMASPPTKVYRTDFYLFTHSLGRSCCCQNHALFELDRKKYKRHIDSILLLLLSQVLRKKHQCLKVMFHTDQDRVQFFPALSTSQHCSAVSLLPLICCSDGKSYTYPASFHSFICNESLKSPRFHYLAQQVTLFYVSL